MDSNQDINWLAAASQNVDDAVGVSKKKWYIAIVNNRSEKSTAEKLSKLGVENYLPTQEELHLWKNGKRAKVTRVVIPAIIFVKCTEKERREIVNLPYIFRFMTNKAATSVNSLNKPLATVSDDEISRLKFMLGASDSPVSFTDRFVKGQKVEVLRGALKGLIGEVLQDADGHTSRLYINIDFLGSASVEINPTDVIPHPI